MQRRYKWIQYIVVGSGILVVLFIHILFAGGKIGAREQKRESKIPDRMAEESQEVKTIRVLIKTNGFANISHDKVRIKAKKGLCITAGDRTVKVDEGEGFVCEPDDELFQTGSIKIIPAVSGDKIKIMSLKRGYGTPAYRGTMELFSTAEGIIIVNELSMEEYLCGVVPSEMPAAYHTEALKCQAICARSYAYCQTKKYAYPEYKAHVDDSTTYQVYGNSKEQESTTQAVQATEGLTVQYGGKTVITYYFSTSCGCTTSVEAWGTKLTKKNRYLQGAEVCDESKMDYERAQPWYRWSISIAERDLKNLLELNTGVELGNLSEVAVTKRGVGDIALKLRVKGSKGSVTIETENQIRRALGGGSYEIIKQDGSVTQADTLLPSAFFEIKCENGIYAIEGGGFGHGIGMSQNGANEMAKAGKNYKEILALFYPGCSIA